MSLPRRSKKGCGLTSTRKYRSPGGAPIVPELPLPGTRKRAPFASPGGILTSIVSVLRTRPSPPQVRHGVRIFPVPPHRVHGTLNRILPAPSWILPLPLQTGQACCHPIPPAPWHVSHLPTPLLHTSL